MVYDPIRDCDIPSPSVNTKSSLRGLLNDPGPELPRRSSSAQEESDSHRPSLSNILNDPAPASSHPPSHPATDSMSPRGMGLESQLPPVTPVSTSTPYPSRLANSHSPMVQISPPGESHHRLPQESPLYSSGYGDMRHGSMLPPQHPIHPMEYDHERRTPSGSHAAASLSARSPSVSLSPRSQHPALPYASRPGSAAGSSHAIGMSPVMSSRRVSEDQRPTSARSTSSASSRRNTEPAPKQAQVPPSSVYRPRQTPTPGAVTAFVPRSNPPQHSSSPSPSPYTPFTPAPSSRPPIPYKPSRNSAHSSITLPIYPDELDHLRQVAERNNPLRRRPALSRRSFGSGGRGEPTPGPRKSLPSENETSYFPPQHQHPGYGGYDDRHVMSASGGSPSSITPTPGGHGTYNQYPPGWDAPTSSSGGPLYHASLPPRPSSGAPGPGYGGNGYGSEGGYEHAGKKRERDAEDERHTSKKIVVGPASGHAHSQKVAAVANHYNQRPDIGVDRREFSPIIGLKKFNNWIKSVLIGKFAFRPRGKVLDVGCGKGGDLNKWKQARIALYVGIDLAEQSVQQAADRYHKMLKPGFDGFFFAHDCFSNPISDILTPQLQVQNLYDNVSMQFCMHYAFENAAKARMMIENVSRYLRPGGTFMGTIPDAELLLDRLNELPEDDEELRFGNACYSIQFSDRRSKGGVYGHEYRFFLEDAVEDVPEYLVDWDNFVSLASEYRLKLTYKKPFHEILEEEKDSRDFGPLLGKMGVVNEYGESAMDADQWEAANLYMGFAFEKV